MKDTSKKSAEKTYKSGEVLSMLEAIHGDIKLIAEVQTEHTKKFDAIDVRFDRLETKVDRIDMRVGSLEIKVDSLEIDMGVVKEKIGTMEGTINTIEKKIDRLQDDMVEVKYFFKKKIEKDEKVEKRVVKLEKLSLA